MRKIRSNTNAPSGAWRFAIFIAAILLPLVMTSCGKKGQNAQTQTAQKHEDDFLDKDAKPNERKYLLAGEAVLYGRRQSKIRGGLRATLQPRQGADVPRSV